MRKVYTQHTTGQAQNAEYSTSGELAGTNVIKKFGETL
jgi:hypothetical protein